MAFSAEDNSKKRNLVEPPIVPSQFHDEETPDIQLDPALSNMKLRWEAKEQP
jgi:hypothetical protein